MRKIFRKCSKYLVILLAIMLIPQSLNIQSELNMRVIVTAISVDYEDEKYNLSAQIVKPSSTSEGGSAQIDIVSVEGETVADAVEKISYSLGRTTGLSHISCIVLGKSILEEDRAIQSLDYFLRRARIPSTALVVVAEDKAKEELEKTKKLQLSSAVGLQKIFLYKENNFNGIFMQLQGFINDYFSVSGTGMVSGLKIETEDKKDNSSDSQGSGGGGSGDSQQAGSGSGSSGGESSGSSSSEKNGRIKYDNPVYMFRKGKYVCQIDDKDMVLGLYMLNKNSNEGVISVENINNEFMSDAKVGIYMRDKKAKIKVDFKDGKPVCTIHISTNRNEVYTIETEQTSLDIYETGRSYLTQDVIEAMKDKIENCVLSVFNYCKEQNVDVFHIGDLLYRKSARNWKRYTDMVGEDNYLSDIDVKVEVKIKKQL